MSIKWEDGLKTGIQAIDEQHQFIVDALSEIQILKLKKAELFQLLIDLQAYLSCHFDLEEKYMIDTNYPEFASHKADHDKVLQDTKNILTQYNVDVSPSEIAMELVNYMQNWFLDHYSNIDVKMAEYLKLHLGKIS